MGKGVWAQQLVHKNIHLYHKPSTAIHMAERFGFTHLRKESLAQYHHISKHLNGIDRHLTISYPNSACGTPFLSIKRKGRNRHGNHSRTFSRRKHCTTMRSSTGRWRHEDKIFSNLERLPERDREFDPACRYERVCRPRGAPESSGC